MLCKPNSHFLDTAKIICLLRHFIGGENDNFVVLLTVSTF